MPFDPSQYLLPVDVATGAPTSQEGMLLLAYRGIGVIAGQGKGAYLTLANAIRWNEMEAEDSDGFEKKFRESLADELKKIQSEDENFVYSAELRFLWSKVFPEAARALLKSKSSKVEPKVREAIRSALEP
ncbi:hypothetical protein [Thiobacillus denitrificans]|uniref:hypothetical protein n=1 Tax=Thiobacillus denitrificans TaxID=36861 RepID=UPI00059DA790|nr:hypothetical protein [Thiobacillus denitrificans]